MATNAQATNVIGAAKDLAKRVKALKSDIDQALGYNASLALDWNNLATSNADMVSGGLVSGESFAPADVSNVIGSLAAIQTLWTTHGGNFEKFSIPVVNT